MAEVSLNKGGLGILLRKLADEAPRRARAAMVKSAHMADTEVTREIDRRDPSPVDRGTYRRGWSVQKLPDGARLQNETPHAAIVEEGSRPHWAPLDPLIDWVIRKGLVHTGSRSAEVLRKRAQRTTKSGRYSKSAMGAGWAFIAAMEIARAVQRKIAHHGTKGRHILRDASRRFPPHIERAIREELKKL